MRGRNSRPMLPRACEVCNANFVPSREGHTTCSSTCRSRKLRGTYVPTAEDRAAMLVAEREVPIPVPPLTPEQVRTHVLATARRGGEASSPAEVD